MSDDLPAVEVHDGHIVYPMPEDARLANFDRFDFYHRRYLRSDFYRNCITNKKEAAGFYGLALWAHAADETPVGTIPTEEVAQAHMVGLGADVKRWRMIAADALHGFLPLVKPCGTPMEGRKSRPLIVQVCYAGWRRDQKYKRANEQKKINQRRNRLCAELAKSGANGDFFKQPDMADMGLAFLAAHGLATNPENARRAVTAITEGWEAPPNDGNVVPFHAAN